MLCASGGIDWREFVAGGEQSKQMQQPLQIQQARSAVQLEAFRAVTGRADAAIGRPADQGNRGLRLRVWGVPIHPLLQG